MNPQTKKIDSQETFFKRGSVTAKLRASYLSSVIRNRELFTFSFYTINQRGVRFERQRWSHHHLCVVKIRAPGLLYQVCKDRAGLGALTVHSSNILWLIPRSNISQNFNPQGLSCGAALLNFGAVSGSFLGAKLEHGPREAREWPGSGLGWWWSGHVTQFLCQTFWSEERCPCHHAGPLTNRPFNPCKIERSIPVLFLSSFLPQRSWAGLAHFPAQLGAGLNRINPE